LVDDVRLKLGAVFLYIYFVREPILFSMHPRPNPINPRPGDFLPPPPKSLRFSFSP
jgi:hypothetical protein